ncbi:MAG: hypothetical protein RJQ09_01505 [Cyclobacteriaceae bacterium]
MIESIFPVLLLIGLFLLIRWIAAQLIKKGKNQTTALIVSGLLLLIVTFIIVFAQIKANEATRMEDEALKYAELAEQKAERQTALAEAILTDNRKNLLSIENWLKSESMSKQQILDSVTKIRKRTIIRN